MPENFDVGSLTWVKDEINQSLDSVLENLATVQANVHDTSTLRFSQTYLYQASGALDMVGLEGCKRFCAELEKLSAKLEKKSLEATPELIEAMSKAVKTLKYYIQELLNGAPDIPLRLYPVLNPLVIAQGEVIEESELFFPDTTNSAPKDIPTKQLDETEYAKFIVEQRLQYQKSLLTWLQTKQTDAIESMTSAIGNVSQAQQKSSNKTLWWAAGAFTETLELPGLADNSGVKRLCRRLDQELKQMTAGINKPHSNLLRDILYYVAISDTNKQSVVKVKEVFELDSMIDKKSSVGRSAVEISADELAHVKALTETLGALREIWDDVSNSIDFDKLDANSEHTLVDLDNVLITKFADTLKSDEAKASKLSHAPVADLYHALQQASMALRDDKNKANQAALIEIAAALHLLDECFSDYEHLDADLTQKVNLETQRLQAVAAGEAFVKPEGAPVDALDSDTMNAIVKDIHASLKIVEQALDSFFRNPNEKSPLTLCLKPLKQVAAIFDMLAMPTPTAIAHASEQFIAHFQQDDYAPNQSEFELLAESLSMIGLYADEMPNARAESEQALNSALTRLNGALTSAGIATAAPEEVVNVTQAVHTESIVSGHDIAKSKAMLDSILATHAPESLLSETAEDDSPKLLDKALDAEFLDIYLTESEEVLAHIAQNLQALRVNPTDASAIVEVRRSYHTLKGSGRTVGLAAMGEVAGRVEKFLNGIIDEKTGLAPRQVATIEQATAAFAAWAAELRAREQVEVNQAFWLAKIDALSEPEQTASGEAPAKPSDSHVLIGGTRKMGHAFFDVFINESMQNVTILEQDVAKLVDKKTKKPAKNALHAVHTLASNALAAEFTQMGELGRALEAWLDETVKDWSPKHLVLYQNVVKTIAGMWQKISKLDNPRSAQALVHLLNQAAEQAKQAREAAPQAAESESPEEALLAESELDEDFELAAEPDTIEEAQADDALQAQAKEAPQEEIDIKDETEYKENASFAEGGTGVELKLVTEARPYSNENRLDTSEVDHELLTMFIDEAHEILPEIGTELRAWRGNPKAKEPPESLQRSLHTLKGSARMAGQAALGGIAHEFEELVVRAVKHQAMPEDFEKMFTSLDRIGAFFEETVENAPEEASKQINNEDAVPSGRSEDRKGRFLRMRADTLDRLINEAGEISIIRSRMDRELVGFKNFSGDLTESLVRLRDYLRELEIEAETQMQSRMNVLQEANETFDPLEFDRFTRLQELTRMMAESVNDVGTIQTGLLSSLDQTEAALQQQNRMNRDLQQGLLGVRMLPFKQIADRMQRIVRQTARELKKSVDLVIVGEDTEIDRSVLDKLGAPLEHLLRNSIAHGIELPAERKAHGKPEAGTIRLNVRLENDEIHITVSDDGAGIDLKRVKAKAIKNNILSRDSDISEQILLSVIFETGFSTAETISQIAGRGVGLDVVRNDINGLGGRVDLTSEFGKGATFNVHLPVTQSIAQTLFVRSGDATYALPVGMIKQAQKIKRHELVKAYTAGEISWAGSQYPLHYLSRLLDKQEHEPEDHAYVSILLLQSGPFSVALHIDEVIGNQEVVMKPIGVQLARVPGIVGATVASDGSIVLIINPVQIANREQLTAGKVSVKEVKRAVEKVAEKIRALVVDDSLTMRKVLGRLLERDGYEVLLAKDGMDAMQLLQEITPDIILTDIEMPRMDGFGLARNIRDDARTAKTPLIMISSRTADKHQNLASEIGVDAFFGKPVQDDDLINKMRDLLKSNKVLH